MNGTIGVESTPGEGSIFSISLPVCLVQPDIVESENIPAKINGMESREEVEPFKLLYFEDNPANLVLVEDILTDYPEVKLFTATHAKIGINMALSLKPNLILMDINLPDIDGIEALKRLRNFEETHATPVVAISANAMKKDIDRAMAEGFKAYITKPINIGKFRKFIEEELKSSSVY